MKAPFLRIVAGTGIAAPPPGAELAPPPRKKAPVPYKDHEPIEYQDGLPIIDPAGEADKIFLRIAKHREAAAHFDRCVTIQNEAEGKVSDAEFFHLQNNASNACEQMMLHARGLILCRPTTRRGLIHQVRYLAAQFTDPNGCAIPSARKKRLGNSCFCEASPRGCARWQASSPSGKGRRP